MKRPTGSAGQPKAKKQKANVSTAVQSPSPQTSILWPALSPVPSSGLELQQLAAPGLALVPNILNARDCAQIISLFSNPTVPVLQPPCPPGKDEAARTNWRWSGTDPAFANLLWRRFTSDSDGESILRQLDGPVGTTARAMNQNIRVYRYEKGQSFGKHYDDSVFVGGLRSEWTLLIYLTGVEDGVQGGETIFYPEARVLSKRDAAGKTATTVVPIAPVRGTALLHRHGRECALHEGAEVLKGIKWVLRSDVLFGKV
ncbi:hypothetical protein BKA62DRAFT_325392 [Auriculariales sp. MPI-PUGE-AT-0066]|nr:hypothetical protein BKA62DRAFT_325392 [Auriculariales sp. MPI-PUGE-AT-0066]